MMQRISVALLCATFCNNTLNALPATHAYLSVPELKALVHDAWTPKLKSYQSIIDQALIQEMVHENTHHVFYHAQKHEYRIVQDFIKCLYHFMHPHVSVENFHFLRSWHDSPAIIDANEFIDAYEMGNPKSWNDNKPYLSKRMLSVNFSLFGSTKNYGHFGECTFKYFFNNKSVKPPSIHQIFEEIFDYFELDKKYIPELIALGEEIKTTEGSLFQIFVPMHLVDNIAFAAQRLGSPYRNDLLMSHLFHPIKQRYLSLTPILDVYRENPATFGITLDRLQGRLLFSQNILLNPLSGVKMFRYTTIAQKDLEKYDHKFKKLTKHIFESLKN